MRGTLVGTITRVALLLCGIIIFLVLSVLGNRRVIVNMASKNHRVGVKILKEISFCVDCPSPDKQGSIGIILSCLNNTHLRILLLVSMKYNF